MWLFLENIWRAKVTRWVYKLYISLLYMEQLQTVLFELKTKGMWTCAHWIFKDTTMPESSLGEWEQRSSPVFIVYSCDGMKMVNIFMYEWSPWSWTTDKLLNNVIIWSSLLLVQIPWNDLKSKCDLLSMPHSLHRFHVRTIIFMTCVWY